jgi:VWFA-related protein
MRKPLSFAVVWLLAQVALAQTAARPGTIQSNSTLVVVPTLVETASGEPVPNLRAADFRVTDNGVPQQISLEEAEGQPVAVVVLMQTGGAAARQFANYAGLTAMLDSLTGGAPHRVALVTFDSRPEEASDFMTDVEDLKEDLTHPTAGDDGAAILDAVGYGVNLLRQQPANMRRVLLLLSQRQDDGSKASAQQIVHLLGETNTLIYSVTFSVEKTWLKDQFTKPRHENGLYQMSPDLPPLEHTFDLGTPIAMALQAMRKNTAGEIATLSGGESLPFGDKGELDRELNVVTNHIPSRYTLSFRPTSGEPGFHAIRVEVVGVPAPLTVKARKSYWATGPE